jgi:hypothetical protein
LGLGRTVAEIEQGMSGQEMRDWELYWALEPWGAYRDNLHSGVIAAAIINVHRRKGQRPLSPADFMLVDRESRRVQNTRKALNWLRALSGKKKKDSPYD